MNNTTKFQFTSTTMVPMDINMTERWIEAVFLAIVALAALIGNISLWLIINRSKRLRSNSNMFILCLSGADILVSAVNMPVIVYTILAGDWDFSQSACVVLGFITMLTFVASVMSLGAISINRYIMICHIAKYKVIYTTRNTILIIVGVWFLSALLALPPLVGWASYDYLPGQSVCFCYWKTSVSYTFFMVAVCFGGPCSVMTFCYINILRVVRESKRKTQSSLSGRASTGISSPESSQVVDSTTNTFTDEKTMNNNEIAADKMSDNNNKFSHFDRNPSYKKANKANEDSLKSPSRTKFSSILFFNSPLKRKSTGENLNESTMSNKERKRERRRQEELRLTTSFLVVIFCFILCWFPFCITMFISVFSDSPVPRIPDMITILLGCTNSCLNPIIYGIMNRNFREGFKKLYCRCPKKCNMGENETSSTARSTST